ncbi:hypothetical protein HPT27_10620 [Permianibacter sp. IMCC34836]|uniref:hypothetical protein n=1 Tax=Permianibacter fluminis TaxID=2738515 RepID=UPI0015537C0E|nr:hypothetical protein [Permianibacter fluminis]NQD37481.1 hypothetical protein [Permianibacter fluminis]
MRTDLPQTYLDAAASERHQLRLVVEIEFDASNRFYFTSHADIKNIPGTVVYNSVKGLSAFSQKLNMIAARAEIGEINFELVDKNRYVTDLFRAQASAGRGINGRTVRVYQARKVGVVAPDFLTDFGLFQTQEIAKDVKTDGGRYKIQCQDVQRNLRPEIFNPAKTRLASNFMKGATTLTVYQTAEFEFCPHGPSFTDAPGTLAAPLKVIYVTISSDAGKEICRATAKTSTTFTITGRGLFGTRELDHIIDGSPGADNGPEVIEFIYLELPAPKFAYAIATGRMLGQGGADASLYTLPSRWRLDIAESFMVLTDFNNADGHITDWYNPADDTGLVLRIDGAEKTEGKAWLETQVLLPMGAFMPVNSKGQLGLRRMTRVLSDAATISTFDERCLTKIDDISYNLAEIYNRYVLNWSYLNLTDKPKYWRNDEVIDQPSIDKWKKEQTKELSFQTLHASRHTRTVTRSCINWLRDMYAGPPINTKLSLMPAYDTIEVGDVHRVKVSHIPDHLGLDSLDRAMMIIGASIDQDTGKVQAEMFGSTFAATPLADLLSGNAVELPDAWYNSQGTALTALSGCVISGGVMTSAPTAGINGGADITATGSIFYYLGDLTIPSSVILNITGNVWLRVRGHLQIEGEIRGIGGGMAAGQSGFIGPTESGGALRADWRPAIEVDSFPGPKVAGKVAALPMFGLDNAGGVLKGMPKDLRGTGSANAGALYDDASAAGGVGVAGGAGLMITSRGGGLGAAGKVNISGAAGNAGGIVNFQNVPNWQFQASSSGGGAPGCLLWTLDGALATVPILPGRFIADYGALNYGAGFVPAHRQKNFRPIGANLQAKDYARVFKYHSYNPGKGGEQVGLSACRIVFIPPSLSPYPDYVTPQIDAVADAAANATTDISLVARGQCVATGNTIKKVGGSVAWDSDCYSRDSYTGGAFVSFRPQQANAALMVGLNSDPSTDQNYASIDYALYCRTDGTIYAYINGTSQGQKGTYVAGDVLAVTYDGVKVRWLKNGAVIFSVTAAADQTLFMDSSFSSPLGLITAVRFGPMTSNNWADVGGANRPEDNATLGANLATNVTNRYTTHLARNSGDSTALETVIQRIGNTGKPLNQRFLRAFHAPGTQAAKGGTGISAADVGSTATITIPAWTLETDVGSISYNSGSITGLSFSTKYFVYCTDSDLQGGAVTYVASTDYKAPSQNADRVFVGSITTPADGGGGTGGGSGGGDYCVAVTALLPDVAGGKPWRAALARAGKDLWVLNDTDDGTVVWPIRSVDFATADCLELETVSGIKLTISTSTPITLKGGEVIRSPECLGREVPVLDAGVFRWEPVIALRPAGLQMVARVHADQLTYAAGDQPDRYILTHNVNQKP